MSGEHDDYANAAAGLAAELRVARDQFSREEFERLLAVGGPEAPDYDAALIFQAPESTAARRWRS